jgi:ABC-type microcin C transport system permease subunit YejB
MAVTAATTEYVQQNRAKTARRAGMVTFALVFRAALTLVVAAFRERLLDSLVFGTGVLIGSS